MVKIVTNGFQEKNIRRDIEQFSKFADEIRIAVAFFTDGPFIENLLDQEKAVSLTVSLRHPTNYYALHNLIGRVQIRYLGSEFHSKIFLFKRNDKPFAAVVGSSNLSIAGLARSIETNVILTGQVQLNEIAGHVSYIEDKSDTLTLLKLTEYKAEFDDRNNRRQSIPTQRPTKVGVGYLEFCDAVNTLSREVWDIASEEFPEIPIYLGSGPINH